MSAEVIPLPGIDPVALLQQMVAAASGEVEVKESDLPVPPNGVSSRGQMLWYAVLKEHGDLGIARMQLLEAIVENITHYDRIKDEWIADGSPTTATGSMGQPVEDNRIGSMKTLRSQEAALWKQIDLANGGVKRRPGRPTRNDGGGGKWGIR